MATLVLGARNEEQLHATGWKLTPEQIAKPDAASDVPISYPYCHQRLFPELNPKPV